MNFPSTSSGQGVHVNSFRGEKFSGILQRDKYGSVRLQLAQIRRIANLSAVFGLFECSCDAAHPEQHALANFGQHFAASHNVGYG